MQYPLEWRQLTGFVLYDKVQQGHCHFNQHHAGNQRNPDALPAKPGQSHEHKRVDELAGRVQHELHGGRSLGRQSFRDLVMPEIVDRAQQRLSGNQREDYEHVTAPAAQKRPV